MYINLVWPLRGLVLHMYLHIFANRLLKWEYDRIIPGWSLLTTARSFYIFPKKKMKEKAGRYISKQTLA